MAASTAPTTTRRSGDRVEQAIDVAISAFLWGIRIVVVLVIVVGSFLTLSSGRYGIDNWISFIREGATLGAVYALLALGYNDREASAAVRQLPEGVAVADGIKQALKALAKA